MPRRPPSRSSRPAASSAARRKTGSGPSQRQLRVGEMLRHVLADVLRDNEIRDPELDGVSVTVTEVRASPDMRHATVFCEPLGGQNAKAIVAALNRHRGFLRGALGGRITMKFTPELRFIEDESFAEAERIERILKSPDVQRDLNALPSKEDDDAD